MSPDLRQVLERLDEHPTVAAYADAARQVRQHRAELQPVRVALLATFTIDLLVPYLEVEAARVGFAVDVYVGPFNTVAQELLDPGSGCIAHRPDVVFVAQQLGDVCPPLAEEYLALDGTRVAEHTDEVIKRSADVWTAFRRLSTATLVVHNFAVPPHALLGIYEPMAAASQTEAIRGLNGRLAEAARGTAGVYVLDHDRICAEVGLHRGFDGKMWHLGGAPLSADALMALARTQAAFVRAICGSPSKCLVLDLDNTLWGGVLGESDHEGIQLGHAYPGNVFRAFQRAVLQLYRRGVILAVNSKNNEGEVEEVFRSHPDMVLRPEHFACVKANWRDKPENMLEIAQELNIGVDSLVFFDDDPVERERMRQVLPQVRTLEVPRDPTAYVRVLYDSRVFDKVSWTEEDRRRGVMYRSEAARARLERSATSLAEFLASLEMTVAVRPVDESSFARALDLIHKTSQFNLTTRRHSAGRLTEMLADPAFGVFCLRAGDRFGDHGIVGLAIVHLHDACARLDTLLLSCRVIGRSVETAFLSFLADWASARGAKILDGEFIRTAKNAPAEDVLRRHGFQEVGGTDGATSWHLDLQEPLAWPTFIRRVNEAVSGDP